MTTSGPDGTFVLEMQKLNPGTQPIVDAAARRPRGIRGTGRGRTRSIVGGPIHRR